MNDSTKIKLLTGTTVLLILLNVVVIGVPTLIALALCLYELPTRSIYLDESATIAVISQHGDALDRAGPAVSSERPRLASRS